MDTPLRESRSTRMLLAGLLASVICSASAAAVEAPARSRCWLAEGRWVLGNGIIERVVETRPFLHTVSITNKMATPARRRAIDSRGFLLCLDDNQSTLSAADFEAGTARAEETDDGARLVVPLTCSKLGVTVTAAYSLGHRDFHLRKQLEIDSGAHLLKWVDVESLRLGELELQRFDTAPMPFPGAPWDIPVGRPLFAGREVFLGVEHPASQNTFDDQGWISLRQHPGRKGKILTSPAVIGVCPDRPRERLSDCFERYIEENRARPVRRSIQWVAYFSVQMDDDACREKIAVAERVFRRRGAPLDLVLMDSGWTNPQSIMAISPERPNRLALIARLAKEQLGAKLGLHVITSGVKAMVDKDWLAAQGYDMIFHESRSRGAYCFADPRVLAEFRDHLVGYVRDYGIASYKFDWGHFACGAQGHRGHLPGTEYGFEAGAGNFVRVHHALREANPDIFLFNTGWYSPWWLWSYDAVFAAGADYNFGLAGPPSFSTASLLCTWRDATIRGNIVRWSPYFPINSLMTVDPVSYWWHAWDVRSESPLRPFTDYFITACLRGTQMTEIYNNIAAWSDDHADAAVAVLKWIKAHDDVILASTRYVGGDPLRGEPYGYAHFAKNNRGILVIRNPAVEPRTLQIAFDEHAGMWPSDGEYVLRTVYPYATVSPEPFRYGATRRQMLAGNEVRVLEVWPVDALPEAMPVGCRYRVVSRGGNATTFELSAPPEQLEVLSPTPVHNAAPAAGRPHRYVLRRSDSPASAAGRDEPAIETSGRFENGEYVVRVKLGEGWRGRVSLLFDRRGVKGQTILDGKPVVADTPHIQLPDAIGRVGAGQGLRAQASDWSLFGVEAPHGEHLLRWTPASPPPPPRTTKCLVIVEANRQMPPRHRLTVEHGAMPLPQGVLLPQNWTWEERFVETLELATETPGD